MKTSNRKQYSQGKAFNMMLKNWAIKNRLINIRVYLENSVGPCTSFWTIFYF